MSSPALTMKTSRLPSSSEPEDDGTGVFAHRIGNRVSEGDAVRRTEQHRNGIVARIGRGDESLLS